MQVNAHNDNTSILIPTQVVEIVQMPQYCCCEQYYYARQ